MRFSVTKKAVIALCLVGLSFTLLNISVRLMSTGFGTFSQTYLRIGLGLLLTLCFFFRKIDFRKYRHLTRHDWGILACMGSFGYGFAIIFVTLGVLHTKLLNVAIVSSTTPFFVLLFSVLFLRKRIKRSLFFFLLLSFYGVCVIATKSFLPVFNQFGIGEFYVMLYAAGIGVYIEGRKFLSKKLNNTEIAIVVMAIAFAVTLISALFSRETLTLSGFSIPTALLGLAMGGCLNLAVVELENFGFENISAVAGSQLLLLQNIYAPIWGFFLYHETILAIELFGAWCVLVGILAYHHLAAR